MRWGFVLALLAGCIESSSVTCKDGTQCPNGSVCAYVTNPDETLCVDQAQIDACAGTGDHVACHTNRIATGRCYDGTCLAIACGNNRIDVADPAVAGDTGELCDDGNNVSGDGCSADCLSDETCGNGVLDGVTFEQCDDGNLVDHDGCDSRCLPETPAWHELALDELTPLESTAMAYDVARRQAVLFGGYDAIVAGNQVNATWLWSGTGWQLASPAAAPVSRIAHAMAYDAARERVIVYGGFSSQTGALDDTWEWDGLTWRTIASPLRPPARTGAAMAYDAVRHRIVMFGGAVKIGLNSTEVNETWEWDGTTWTRVPTQGTPLARAGAALAFDPVRGRIMMFGGGAGFTLYGDVWDYDGMGWHPVTTNSGPTARAGARMAWDAVTNALLVFGGDDGSGPTRETWVLNGTTWTPHNTGVVPSPRSGFGMAADPFRGRIVVFGEVGSGASTWEWDGARWLDVTPPSAAGFLPAANQVAYDTLRGRAVAIDDTTATWESDGASWTSSPDIPSPARTDAAMTFDAARGETVLFGGYAGNALADTWTWKGGKWTQQTPAHAPSARITAIAYDARRDRTVLFGGALDPVNAIPLDDTWEWDGTDWTAITPAHRPPARWYHALVYDPFRHVVVLFAGAGVAADTWTWDGVDWTEQHPAHFPAPRRSPGAVWSPERRAVAMFGGGEPGAHFDDLWMWDGNDWTFVPAGTPPKARSSPVMFAGSGGLVVFAGLGTNPNGGNVPLKDSWRMRWDGSTTGEVCETADSDGDTLAGCTDPDCWARCTPTCPPGTSCAAGGSRCGDGTCNAALEDCWLCPADCGACTARCGDFACAGTESHATCPGDCP